MYQMMTMFFGLLSGFYLLVGSYAPSESEGIRVYDFDETTGEARYVSGLSGIANPSFLCADSTGLRIYSVGEAGGSVSSANFLRFDARKGRLTLVGSRPTHGAGPCHIALSPNGRTLVTSNYSGGSVTAFPLASDGRILPGKELKFQGSSVHPQRQTHPYLHSTFFSPDNRWMWSSDLGTDVIHAFPLTTDGTPQVNDSLHCAHFIRSGLGPRHLCFAPDCQTAYVLGELSGEVCTLRYMHDGSIRVYQVLQADSLNAEGSADIHLTRDGRHLYTSHRLRGDGISIFEVQDNGLLQKTGYQPTGIHPRHFTLSPDEHFLLVACRDDNVIQVFRRNQDTGLLSDTGLRIQNPSPVCLLFVKKK